MSTRTLRTTTPLILVALLATLSSGSRPASAQTKLRWKFKTGDKFQLQQTQDMKMTMTVGGREIKTSVKQIMDIASAVTGVDEKGVAEVTQKVSRIRFTMTAPGGLNSAFDSASDEDPQDAVGKQIAPLFRALAKAQFKAKINPRGETLKVEVPKDVLQEMQKLPFANALGGLATEEGMKKMTQLGAGVFPAEAVANGKTWSRKIELKNAVTGNQTIETTYGYLGEEKVGGRVLQRISVDLKMSFDPNNQAAATIKITDQKASGLMRFDNVAGRIVDSKLDQIAIMEITAGGQVIKQKIEQTVGVKSISSK